MRTANRGPLCRRGPGARIRQSRAKPNDPSPDENHETPGIFSTPAEHTNHQAPAPTRADNGDIENEIANGLEPDRRLRGARRDGRGGDHDALVAASTIARNAAAIEGARRGAESSSAFARGTPLSRADAIAALVRNAKQTSAAGAEPKRKTATSVVLQADGYVAEDDDVDVGDDDDTDDEVVTKPAKKKTAKKKDKAVKKKKTKTKTRTPFDTHAMADSRPVKVRSEITDPYLAAVVGSTDAHRVVNRKFRADAKFRESVAEPLPCGGPSTTAPVCYPSMIRGAK